MIGRIADYELLEKIGEGGMGAVFKGRNPRLDNVVAVKILLDELARDPEHRARFLREARAEAQLHHSSIATCFDVGEARLEPPDLLRPGSPGPHPERVLYLVMEYVPGSDLHELVGDRPIEIPKVLDLAIQIAAGLESAHKAGVIHRDLKSTNIRVMPDGQIKIVDFGLSRIEQAGLLSNTLTLSTSPEQVLGTVQFMAPEQQRGRTTDPRSDLFSLGVILYQLVTGRLPFAGATLYEVVNAVAAEDPPPLARYASNVPEELERIVRKLIAKDPEHRYQSAHEVRIDLERLRQTLVEAKSGWTPRPAPSRWPRAAWIGAAALVVLLAAGWAWLRYGPRPARSIAVMPFVNRTGDTRLDYLGDGIAANLIADLVRGGRFNVASFKSALDDVDPGTHGVDAVAAQLGVSALVEGVLRREGGITYLDVQLTGRRGFVLWANRFLYALNDAPGIEHEITRQIMVRIDPWRSLAPGISAGAPSRSPSAYDLCLRAGSYLEDPDDPQGPDRALEYYSRAAEIDPAFALAWAGQSRALWKIWSRDKNEESIRRAEEAANHAVQLNPELLEARLARAQIYRATSRFRDSVRELEEVLRTNPQWNDALIHLAASYRDSGNLVLAEEVQRRAVALQPEYWRNWDQLGQLLFRAAKYDGAAAAFREVIRLLPEKNRGYENLAAVETKRGDYTAAIATYQRLPSPITSGQLASNIGTAFYFDGRLGEARRYYGLALALDPRDYHWWLNLGDLHSRLAQPDSAHAAYTRALGLVGEQLHVNPRNARLGLDQALLLAKQGECGAARAALAQISGQLPPTDAESALGMARLHAVCHRHPEAIAELRRALALGASWSFIERQDEFVPLAHDPAYLALSRTK